MVKLGYHTKLMKFLLYLIVVFFFIANFLQTARPVEANYGSYGQGQTHGVKKEEIKITEIKTGLDDINPSIIGAVFLAVSGVMFYKSRKASHTS